MINSSFINYLLSTIIYEEKTRTKTSDSKLWIDDSFQRSVDSFVQQRERIARFSDALYLHFRSLAFLYYRLICYFQKIR